MKITLDCFIDFFTSYKDTQIYDNFININHISISSKDLNNGANSVFFALIDNRDGHDFVEESYQSGIRTFVVSHEKFVTHSDANYIWVKDTKKSLIEASSRWKSKLVSLKNTIGITGSNGKTIVKDWLHYVLLPHFPVSKSPRSYNSQIGVALSVSSIEEHHILSILEAGISNPHEMQFIEDMIKPNYGVFTNLGDAHLSNFEDKNELLDEKWKLFKNSQKILFPIDDEFLKKKHDETKDKSKHLTWTFEKSNKDADIYFDRVYLENSTQIIYSYGKVKGDFQIPFSDEVSIYNSCVVLGSLLLLNLDPVEYKDRFLTLPSIQLRSNLVRGIHNSLILDDAYSLDFSSIALGLEKVKKFHHNFQKKIAILTDIPVEHRGEKEPFLKKIETLQFDLLFYIEKEIPDWLKNYKLPFKHFESTDLCIDYIKTIDVEKTFFFIKGSRKHRLEKIVYLLQNNSHQVKLKINAQSLIFNLRQIRKTLTHGTKIVWMVKANAYGIGVEHIYPYMVNPLIDYLGVAIVDEGIKLRSLGVTLPILLVNSTEWDLIKCVDMNMEPMVYSITQFRSYVKYLRNNTTSPLGIHIKCNTGLNRLGFDYEEVQELIPILKENLDIFDIKGVLSHLSASDSEESFLQDYTLHQLDNFDKIVTLFKKEFPEKNILFHTLNSGGVAWYKKYQYNMVRSGLRVLGLGRNIDNLKNVLSLETVISHIHEVNEGEYIGYNCLFKAEKKIKAGIILIGYADGIPISYGQKGHFLIHGKKAKIIGRINMDMCIVDITDISCQIGDTAFLFNEHFNLREMAMLANTIPYEIITKLSQRVVREVVIE